MKTLILFSCLFLFVKISQQQDFGYPAENVSLCCNQIYDKEHFRIVSPGFPNGQLTNFDCEYRIKRANDNICRLKLNFIFFSNGVFKNGDCSNGYIEIDGKKICGCKNGLKLTVDFDRNLGDQIKVIKYNENNGFMNGVHGFSIEVFQDSCPEKLKNKQISNFHERSYYNHYYYYYEDNEQESNYLDISRYDNNNSNNNNYKCSLHQWHYMFKSWFHDSPRCPQKTSDDTSKCVIMNSLKGSFRSAGYPFWYGKNLNQCYRFIQKPGYCSVKVHMLDFQLQFSYNCNKDYLLFDNKYRYCADHLCNQVLDIPFEQSYYDFFFITDKCFCGRGFAAIYEQILCSNETTTITTTEAIPTTDTITTTETELQACGGMITPKEFILEIFEYQENTCRFVVRKINENICALDINFNDFNLDCNERSLTINGTRYCGNKSGEKISLAFNTAEIEILYQGNNIGGRNRILSVQVIQSNSDCSPDLEVPPS